MPEQRRKFSPRFRAEAVQVVIETGTPTAEVARDLGIHDLTWGDWVNSWRRANPEPDQALARWSMHGCGRWEKRPAVAAVAAR